MGFESDMRGVFGRWVHDGWPDLIEALNPKVAEIPEGCLRRRGGPANVSKPSSSVPDDGSGANEAATPDPDVGGRRCHADAHGLGQPVYDGVEVDLVAQLSRVDADRPFGVIAMP